MDGGPQFVQKGLQARKHAKTPAILVPIRMPTVMHSITNTERCGNRRLYSMQIDNFEIPIVATYQIETATRYFKNKVTAAGLVSSRYSV